MWPIAMDQTLFVNANLVPSHCFVVKYAPPPPLARTGEPPPPHCSVQ